MKAPVTPCSGDERTPARIIRKSGFDFGFDPAACMACRGRCCRGESGRIWVDAAEIREISRFLGTNIVDLMQSCIQRVDNRLSIQERHTDGGFQCIFLKCGADVRCSVYPVRPHQCRSYPFWDRYRRPALPPADDCPGIVPCGPQRATAGIAAEG